LLEPLRLLASRIGQKLFRDDRGATIAEYVLLVGFIAVVIIGIVIGFRNFLGDALTNAGNQLSNFK